MKNLNVKAFIWIVLLLSVFICAVVALITSTPITGLWNVLKCLPTVVFVEVVLWFVFSLWAWKLPIFRNWLVPFPCLQGSWKGTLQVPSDGGTNTTIPVMVVIKQTFPAISCTMYSEQMKSQSFSAQFILHPESNTKSLVYTYTSVPGVAVRTESPIHYGAVLLDIVTCPERRLKGEYWTSRQTVGEINLKFNTTQLLEQFPENLPAKPEANVQ